MDNNDFYTDKTEEDGLSPDAENGTDNGYAYENIPLERPKTMAYAIVAMLSGILSLLCCCTGFGGLFFGIAAVVFVAVSKKHLGYFDTKATLGLIFAIFGLLFSAFEIILVLTQMQNGDFWAQFEEMMETYEEGGIADPNMSF